MWLFGKRVSIKKVAQDEEEEELPEELPVFAPEIFTEKEDSAPSVPPEEPNCPSEAEELPGQETEETKDSMLFEELEVESVTPASVIEELQEDKQEGTFREPEKEEEESSSACAEKLYQQEKELSYSERIYALHDGRLFWACPDATGAVYLFEEFGEYIKVLPAECDAFFRIGGLEVSFKGKIHRTGNLEYVFREKAFPFFRQVKNKQEYDTAEKEGYKPFRRSENGKGMRMVNPVSLYRMKDLTVLLEKIGGSPAEENRKYALAIPRRLLEEVDGERQFKKLLCTMALRLEGEEDCSFKVQVLRVRKNLAVCLPLKGQPQVGDRFVGNRITDLALTEDGTVILQIGNDRETPLPLTEGTVEEGQHLLALE